MHTAEMPAPIFSSTWAVTSLPLWETPSSTTPLSAPMMTTAGRLMSGCMVPWIPATRTTASSSFPKLRSGLQRVSHRFQVSVIICRSAPEIRVISLSRVSSQELFRAALSISESICSHFSSSGFLDPSNPFRILGCTDSSVCHGASVCIFPHWFCFFIRRSPFLAHTAWRCRSPPQCCCRPFGLWPQYRALLSA